MRGKVLTLFFALSLLAIPAASAAPVAAQDNDAAQAQNTQPAANALDIAMTHIQQQAPSLGLSSDDIADLLVTSQYVSQHTGVTHIYMRQRHEGIEVIGANLNINVMPDGSILSMHQSFVSNLEAAIDRKHPDLNPIEATEAAADDRGLDKPENLDVIEVVGGVEQEVVLSDGGVSLEPIPARLVYEIVGPGDVRLAWQVQIYETSADHYWDLRVDAATGQVLGENDYVSHAGPEYEAFELPKESPSDGPRTIVIDPAAAAPNASPLGWHDTDGVAGPEFTITRGNNVHAYTDTDANNTPDPGSEPDGGANLHFNFPLDLTQDPSTYRDAAVANLFYWNNIIHDVFYGYGFDEASGNFQVNNYGKGGAGNDAVRAEAQDGSGTNNANFFTPADGSPPRMQMYVWSDLDPSTPHRDSDLDNGVIIHEYGHGISNRLTGGPANAGCLGNQEQMGEGWSDWLALVLTTDPADTATTSRGIGTYVLFEPTTGPGIRQFPYTTDMTVNPMTYDSIKTAAVPHGVGTVWATMLWDMYWQLVGAHPQGYNANVYGDWTTGGNNLAIQLVMDGMKLQPCSPGFVDGRNAILAADVALTGGANQCAIWTAFANRGLGVNAAQGSTFSSTDGTEDFDKPFACGGPPDTADPVGVSVLINGGAGVTPTANVTLALHAEDMSGIDSYFLAETQLGLDSATEVAVTPAQLIFDESVPFTLTAGDGLKEVWFRVCDTFNNCADASDTIDLDSNAAVNNTPISLPGVAGAGSPYPSTINVSGRVGEIVNITVSLWNASHTWPEDLDVLLVGPTGQTLLLMSDAGGNPDLVNADLTFDDAAAGVLPCGHVAFASGTYKPTNCPELTNLGDDIFPGPAPAGPYGSAFAPYLGTNPNGDWDLYVRDDQNFDSGQIAGGWSLSIETAFTLDSYQGCMFSGSLSQVRLLSNGDPLSVSCSRGIAIALYTGTDYWACLYAGSLSQVGTSEPGGCGRGTKIGLHAGTDIWACLYAGSLSQVGTSEPTNCGRGAPIGFVRTH